MTPETAVIVGLGALVVVLAVLYARQWAASRDESNTTTGPDGCTAHHFTDYTSADMTVKFRLRSSHGTNDDGEQQHILEEKRRATCAHEGCRERDEKHVTVAETWTDGKTFDRTERLEALLEEYDG